MSAIKSDPSINSLPFSSKLTLIAYHYLFGPLWGFNQRIFVPDRAFSSPNRFLGLLLYSTLWIGVLGSWSTGLKLATLGFLLLALCPQWFYALGKVQHTIFEYRGAMFPLGMACIMGQFALAYPTIGEILAGGLCGYWIYQTLKRNLLYQDPLLFWKQAHLDSSHDPLLLSAYLYQLQKREQFGTIDDIQKWMLEEQVPDCRALLINMAAAKFGSKSDNAQLDQRKLAEAESILQEVVRRWPDHADGWRNLGTIRYYQNRIMTAVTTFSRALELDPHDSLSWLCMGHCYLELADYESAVNSLRHAYNYIPAGAYLVEDISLIRVKLMEALQLVFVETGQEKYHEEFNQHQLAFEKYQAYFVTDENARFIV